MSCFQKATNIDELRKIVDSMLAMGSITQYEVQRIPLRSMLELKHPWAFSFFHWYSSCSVEGKAAFLFSIG